MILLLGTFERIEIVDRLDDHTCLIEPRGGRSPGFPTAPHASA